MAAWLPLSLGGGVISAFAAMAFLFGTPGAPVAVYLAPLPLMLAGLGLGSKAAAVAGVAGVVGVTALGGFWAALAFGAMNALPAWMVSHLALRRRERTDGRTAWYPLGYVLAAVVVQAAAMLVLGFLATMGAEGGTEAWVSGFLDRSLAAVMPGLGAEARLRVTGAFAQVFPGAVAGSWTLMVVVNGAIAQAILVRAGRNRRPPTPFRALELPHGLTGLLVAAAVVALAGSLMAWPEMRYMGRNLVVVLAVPYVFLGLAVVHTLVPRAPYPGLVLAAFYMVVILAGWPIVVIAATGLVEQWSGIRRRFAPPDDPHGASG